MIAGKATVNGGTLPQARVPEEIAPGKVNVLAATPTVGYVSRPQRDARALQGPNVSTAERKRV